MPRTLISALATTLAFTKGLNSEPVSLTLHREPGPHAHRSLRSSYNASEGGLTFTGMAYYIDYQVGDQNLTGILDTGSSDIWAFSNAAGKSDETFDPTQESKFSSYRWLNNNFNGAYVTGTVSGSWVTDTVSVNEVSVSDYNFAFSNVSNIESFPGYIGIFGISLKGAESAKPKYTPYVQRLKEQGTIASNSFTIFLSKSDASEATLVFGGLDSAKYSGPLYKVPFSLGQLESTPYYAVDTASDDGTKFQSVWDTGSTQVLIPKSQADKLAKIYEFEWDESFQCYVSDTDDVSGKPPVNFTFSGFTAQIPPEDMILEAEAGKYIFSINNGLETPLSNGSVEYLYVLGDPLLRQLSLTFDIDNREYGMAPVKFTNDSKVIPIDKCIPDVVLPS